MRSDCKCKNASPLLSFFSLWSSLAGGEILTIQWRTLKSSRLLRNIYSISFVTVYKTSAINNIISLMCYESCLIVFILHILNGNCNPMELCILKNTKQWYCLYVFILANRNRILFIEFFCAFNLQSCRWVRGCGEWPGTSNCSIRDIQGKAIFQENMVEE